MAIDIQQIINSGFGVSLFSNIARLIPVRFGHRLANFVAAQIAAHPRSRIVRAVRANQWVAGGGALDKQALDLAVLDTFRNSTCSIFDLYHYLPSPAAMKRSAVFDATVERLIQRPEFAGRGLVVVGLHMGSFDMMLRMLTLQGMRPMILTIPDPKGSQRVEFEMRKRTGMNLLPASLGVFRQAIKYLEQGGIVLTGIDRPIPPSKHRPRFFGRAADLPTHHVYLAARARVPVLAIVTIRQPDGKNRIYVSDLIEMETHSDPDVERVRNAEKVLEVGEEFIRQAPRQWGMTLPVWPEALDQMPN